MKASTSLQSSVWSNISAKNQAVYQREVSHLLSTDEQLSLDVLCQSRARLSCLFGIVLVPLFCGLDYIVARQHVEFFFFLRMINTAESLVIFFMLLSFKTLSASLVNGLASLYFLSITFMIAYMCRVLGIVTGKQIGRAHV